MKYNCITEVGFYLLAGCDRMVQLNELRIYEGNEASVESKNALRRTKKLCSLGHIS
jgi:hypothetical protein